MSGFLLQATERAEPFQAKLTTTAATAVFTSTGRNVVLLSDLGICNSHTLAVTITLEVYRAANATAYKRLNSYSLASNTTLELQWATLLYEGDQIRVTASVASVIDVTGLLLQAI